MLKRNAVRLIVVLLAAAFAVVGGTRTASANPNPTITTTRSFSVGDDHEGRRSQRLRLSRR